MSEYNIQMNKYNALNAGYDQLYPQPMKHANTHAKDGSDPITPADIGAYTKTEADALLANKLEKISPIPSGVKSCNDLPTGIFIPNGLSNLPLDDFNGKILSLIEPSSWCQIAVDVLQTKMWFRSHNGFGWTSWQTVATATDLDTKVSKSGDTMTGELNIKANDAFMNLTSWFDANFGNKNAAITSYQSEDTSNVDASRITLNNGGAYYQRCENGVWIQTSPLLNSGNAQTLGFSKIAIGSYVGTGTSDPFGGTQQNSLTFDFEPKMLAVVADGDNIFFAGFLIVRGQTYSDGIGGMANTSVASNLHITWSGNTVSWWSSNRTDVGTKYPQMNAENVTYRYVALG